MEFTPQVDESNPDPRIACALLLDTSSSMTGAPISELNQGFEQFCKDIKDDDLACKRAEISVITFDAAARAVADGTDPGARRHADARTPGLVAVMVPAMTPEDHGLYDFPVPQSSPDEAIPSTTTG